MLNRWRLLCPSCFDIEAETRGREVMGIANGGNAGDADAHGGLFWVMHRT